MPTSILTNSNQNLPLKNQRGFTLLEVMVAIALLGIVLLAVPVNFTQSDHSVLEEDVDNLDRAVRMAQNEAILRNVITRVKLDLEKQPMEFTVEYGTSGDIVLPEYQDPERLSLKELEGLNKRKKTFDGQFTPVEEFSEEVKTFADIVKVIGVASTYNPRILREGILSLYFYPTGERDGAQVYFSTDTDMAYLEVYPYVEETNADFYHLDSDDVASKDQTKENKMKEWFDQWIRK